MSNSVLRQWSGKLAKGKMKIRTGQRLSSFNLQCHCLTSRGGRAGASILAVIPALVNLTAFPTVVGLATALGLLVGIQEATAAVQTLDLAGATRGRCKWKGDFVISAGRLWVVWSEISGSQGGTKQTGQLVLDVNCGARWKLSHDNHRLPCASFQSQLSQLSFLVPYPYCWWRVQKSFRLQEFANVPQKAYRCSMMTTYRSCGEFQLTDQ